MPECQNPLQEELKAYLDRELAAPRRAAVEKHLQSCPACQGELDSLRQLSTQLTATLPATDPLPDALRARILAALPEKPAPRPLSFAFWRRPGPMATLGGALALGCALVLWLRVPAEEKTVASVATFGVGTTSGATGAAPAPAAKLGSEVTRQNTAAPVVEPAAPPAPAEEKRDAQAPVAAARPSPRKQPEPRQPAVAMKGAASPEMRATYANPLPSPSAAKTEAAAPAVAIANRNRALAALSPPLGEDAFKKEKSAEEMAMADATAKRLAPPAALGAAGRAAAPIPLPPLSYTLTVAAGKQAEVTEAVRKLAEELTLPVLSEKPELQLALASEQRDALLERLKALGKLTETPAAVTRDLKSPSAARFGGGGFGGRGAGASQAGGMAGGMSRALPSLRFTLVIKEAEHQEEQ